MKYLIFVYETGDDMETINDVYPANTIASAREISKNLDETKHSDQMVVIAEISQFYKFEYPDGTTKDLVPETIGKIIEDMN